VERYLTEIAKTYNVNYTSPPDLNPEADAIDLMLVDPPYDGTKGGGRGSGGGGGGGVGVGVENAGWTFTPMPRTQPQPAPRSQPQPMVYIACHHLLKVVI